MKFKILTDEMNKKGITRKDLATLLNKSYTAVCNRLAGKTSFGIKEMMLIKNTYFPNYTLDYLFETGLEYRNQGNYNELASTLIGRKVTSVDEINGREMYQLLAKIIKKNNMNVAPEDLEVQRRLLVGE